MVDISDENSMEASLAEFRAIADCPWFNGKDVILVLDRPRSYPDENGAWELKSRFERLSSADFRLHTHIVDQHGTGVESDTAMIMNTTIDIARRTLMPDLHPSDEEPNIDRTDGIEELDTLRIALRVRSSSSCLMKL